MRSNLDDIYQSLAKKHNVSKEDVEHVIYDLWKGIRHEMASKNGKDILISNFGSFYINKKSVKASLKSLREALSILEKEFENGLDWFEYIERWRAINVLLEERIHILFMIEKRENRKKYERGL